MDEGGEVGVDGGDVRFREPGEDVLAVGVEAFEEMTAFAAALAGGSQKRHSKLVSCQNLQSHCVDYGLR